MENKRKAGGSNEAAGLADGEDRVAKRRKFPTPQSPSTYDLFQGETAESTTAYGLSFLEQLRRTNDKSGRLVAVYFEHLIPQDGNEDYYKKIRMPISLQIIERKLFNHEFPNLAALESYFKRMVTNAKEYYNRGSEVYDNAERVRKALSNYMVKTNPAYKLISGYSCHPAPIPSEPAPPPSGTKRYGPVARVEYDSQEEDDAEGDEDEDGDGDEDDEEEVEQEDDEEDDEDDDDDDSDAGPRARRGSRRSRRTSSQVVQKTAEKYVVPSKTKQDHEYDGIAYKRLSFQQAQEKIVEEMIREEDEDEPGWMKFEAFLHLPPRSLKEYFSVITDPLSLRALQKLVKGIHGRQTPTGTSDFKSWAAFEEKASLLWNNAHYFNEEGSPIYDLATELQGFFEAQLKEAKAAVAEPLPPKIKLKVSSAQETPAPTPTGPKKIITIHVANSRGSAAASPAPLTAGRTGDSGPPEMAQNGASAQQNLPAAPNGGPPAAANVAQIEAVKSSSAAVASPGPSAPGLQQGPAAHQSPAMAPRPNGASAHPVGTPNGVAMPGQGPANPQNQLSAPLQNNFPRHVAPPKPSYDNKWRSPGKGVANALIQNLIVRTHPSINVDDRFTFELPAHPRLAQQHVTITIPGNQHKVQIIMTMAPLELERRQYKLFVMYNGMTLHRSHPAPIPGDRVQFTANTLVFDAQLQRGLQCIDVHLIAALPYNEWQPGHANCELEKFALVTHLQV